MAWIRPLPAALLIALVLAPVCAVGLPLTEAVRRRDARAVRALIASRVDLNAAEADGATALHWAVHLDDPAIVEQLLAAGARPDPANDLGITPLSLACTNGSADMVTRLLAAGANPNRPVAVPPLLTCARSGNVRAVSALLAARADVNARERSRSQTALMWAVSRNHAPVTQLLITRGADIHARSAVRRLLVNRANPNDVYTAVVGEVSVGGSTPLHVAARQGSVESAHLLLDAGAAVDDLAPDGTSALVLAAHSDEAAMATLLLERGANPNIVSAGYTALHAAVLRGNLGLVRTLLAKGASVNSRVRHGTTTTRGTRDYYLPETLAGATPFWLAARFLEVPIMRELLAAGADPALGLPDGTTPLMAAAGAPAQQRLFDRRERVTLLREPDEPLAVDAVLVALAAGGRVEAANQAGDTALHAAAAQNYPAVVDLLVSKGARPDAGNAKGQTPLDVATGDEARSALRGRGAGPQR
ncbi:MAG: ankyrin repeat domain-containing protein [Vicinamibacterales bacterium]|nr:ankyrin repeat domain-containing protein [Vicinamibacterales bacterium]